MLGRVIILLSIGVLFADYQAKTVAADDGLNTLIIGATVRIIRSHGDGEGTGVITVIMGRKYVLTANHVIKGTPWACIISLRDNSWGRENRTAGWHDGHDIAAIPLPASLQHLPAIPLYHGTLAVGKQVYLSGFPGGYYHLTRGTVSGFTRHGDEMLHTAPSAGGASGGAVVSRSGHLCGIHTGSYLPGSSLYPNKFATTSAAIIRLVRIHGR